MYFVEIVDDLLPLVRDFCKNLVHTFTVDEVLKTKIIEAELFKYRILKAVALVKAIDDEGNFLTYRIRIEGNTHGDIDISVTKVYGDKMFNAFKDVGDILEDFEESLGMKEFKRVILGQHKIILDGVEYDVLR